MATTYVSPFTGDVIQPTDLSYYALSFASNTQLVWPAVVNGLQVPAARIIDCVATATNLSISLPDASQGTVGADILIRNLGSNTFTVSDALGGQSVVITAGVSKYFYLSKNTTAAGTWENITFGTGTSFADAASLAGSGLTTLNGKLVTTENILSTTTTPVVTDATRASTIIWNGGSGSLSLPTPATLSSGWYIGFRNNGTGTFTISTTPPSTINGNTSIVTNPGDSGWVLYQPSNGNFYTIGLAAPTNVVFTSAVYDVDAIPTNTFDLTAFAPIIQTYVSNSGTRTETLAVELPAVTQLYIISNDTGSSSYNLTFQVFGSSQSPTVVTNGTIATILSDGNNLFVINQSSAALFSAVNGSAGAPSFTFNSDPLTGMYLQGTGVLGLTANGSEIISINGTNSLNTFVQVNGGLTANIISGGQF